MGRKSPEEKAAYHAEQEAKRNDPERGQLVKAIAANRKRLRQIEEKREVQRNAVATVTAYVGRHEAAEARLERLRLKTIADLKAAASSKTPMQRDSEKNWTEARDKCQRWADKVAAAKAALAEIEAQHAEEESPAWVQELDISEESQRVELEVGRVMQTAIPELFAEARQLQQRYISVLVVLNFLHRSVGNYPDSPDVDRLLAVPLATPDWLGHSAVAPWKKARESLKVDAHAPLPNCHTRDKSAAPAEAKPADNTVAKGAAA